MVKEFWSRYSCKTDQKQFNPACIANAMYHCVKNDIRYVFFRNLSLDDYAGIRDACTPDEVESNKPMLVEYSKPLPYANFMIYLLVCKEGKQYENVKRALEIAGFSPHNVCF